MYALLYRKRKDSKSGDKMQVNINVMGDHWTHMICDIKSFWKRGSEAGLFQQPVGPKETRSFLPWLKGVLTTLTPWVSGSRATTRGGGGRSSAGWGYRAAAPSHLGTRDWFRGRRLSHAPRVGDDFRMIQMCYIYGALYFYYRYISATSIHQAWDPKAEKPCSRATRLSLSAECDPAI